MLLNILPLGQDRSALTIPEARRLTGEIEVAQHVQVVQHSWLQPASLRELTRLLANAHTQP